MQEKVEKKLFALESTLCNVSLGSHPVRGELKSYDLQKNNKINDTLPFIGFSPFTLWLGMGISKKLYRGIPSIEFSDVISRKSNFWYKSHPCLYLCSYLDLLNLIVLKSLIISHSKYPQISPTKTAKQRSSSGTVLGRIILRRPEFRWPCKGEISGDGPDRHGWIFWWRRSDV